MPTSVGRQQVSLRAVLFVAAVQGAPELKVWKALQLRGEPYNENFATANQAMNAWSDGAGPGKELLVGLIHQYRNLDKRADDRQFGVVWESDGESLREVYRKQMSCPDVDLVVPSRGPFVYEARLTFAPFSLHPECSCISEANRPCPLGAVASAVADVNGSHFVYSWNLTSIIDSHFVSLENEWRELIADSAVLGRFKDTIEGFVKPVAEPVMNRTTAVTNGDPFEACPGSWDELLGGPDATFWQLTAKGAKLPDGYVTDRWCLVKRGGCSETSKVKVCELSGAIGTIIVDHGNSEGDQEISIRYVRAAKEVATKPVLFISKAEGEELVQTAGEGDGVKVKVGPDVAGPRPPEYSAGSGLVVHRIVGGAGAPINGQATSPQWLTYTGSYPYTYSTAETFCASYGGQLCSKAQYCPDGTLSESITGDPNGQTDLTQNKWAPYRDSINGWIKTGGHSQCTDHITNFGLPGWGNTGSSYGSTMCCDMPVPTPAPPDGSPSALMEKRYPSIFGAVAWAEVSDVRDIMFACLPELAEVRLYDVSDPMDDIPLLGVIERECSRSGGHDYRILDYKDTDGSYKTLLVDPANLGNRLYYYETSDPARPRLWHELHARWEAEDDGLGQVRPGGPGMKLHIVSWHCSSLFCGKNHGDSLYVLDTNQITATAQQVHLPMLSPGSFVRDLVCGEDSVCLVSLTWDGLVALDAGVQDTVNKFGVVASFIGNSPFSSADIPFHMAHLRLYSGAQKVYGSRRYKRRFYVEHADFSLRPLRLGDTVRALQLQQVFMAEVSDYNASIRLPGSDPLPLPNVSDLGREPGGIQASSVTFSMTFVGLDYAKLMELADAVSQLKAVIKKAVVEESGVDGLQAEHVEVSLAAGSVIAYVTIKPPSEVPMETVHSALLRAMPSLTTRLAEEVGTLRDIHLAQTGEVRVSHYTAPVLQAEKEDDDGDFSRASEWFGRRRFRRKGDRKSKSGTPMSMAVILLVMLGISLILLSVFSALLLRHWKVARLQEKELAYLRQAAAEADIDSGNVVVGRPVEAETSTSRSTDFTEATGQPLRLPTVVSATTQQPKAAWAEKTVE